MDFLKKKRPPTQGTTKGSPSVYLYPDVFDEIAFTGEWKRQKVGVGVLVGRCFECPEDGDKYLEVEGFVGGQHTSEWTKVAEKFASEWRSALAAQRFHAEHSTVVGWYIASDESLVGDPALLADVHKKHFRYDWQVGLWFRNGKDTVAFGCNQDNIQPVEFGVMRLTTFTSIG